MNHYVPPTPPDPEHKHEQPPLQPRIYVASLADYVNGRLHGCWIDATTDAAIAHEQIGAMLAASPEPGAEEFAIHDYDEFGGLELGEYDQIEDVVAVAKLIAAHGQAYAGYANDVGLEYATEDDFTDRYSGNYPSVEAFVDDAITDWGWDTELEQLQASSSIGIHLTIARDDLVSLVEIEWQIVRRGDGTVDIFAP